MVVDINGDAIVDTQPPTGKDPERNFKSRPEFMDALSGVIARGSRASDTLGHPIVYVAVPVVADGVLVGALRITYPIDTVNDRIRKYWLVLILLALVTLAAVTLVGVVVARWMNRPLLAVQHSAVALGRGRSGLHAPAGRGPPEVRELAAAFNRRAARLRGSSTRQGRSWPTPPISCAPR